MGITTIEGEQHSRLTFADNLLNQKAERHQNMLDVGTLLVQCMHYDEDTCFSFLRHYYILSRFKCTAVTADDVQVTLETARFIQSLRC